MRSISLPLSKIEELLCSLLEYFHCLFELCGELSAITPPTIANMDALRQRWDATLLNKMAAIVPAYTRLLLRHDTSVRAE